MNQEPENTVNSENNSSENQKNETVENLVATPVEEQMPVTTDDTSQSNQAPIDAVAETDSNQTEEKSEKIEAENPILEADLSSDSDEEISAENEAQEDLSEKVSAEMEEIVETIDNSNQEDITEPILNDVAPETQAEHEAESNSEKENDNSVEVAKPVEITKETTEVEDADDHEESVVDEELVHHVAYNELSRPELLDLMKELAHQDDLSLVKVKFQQIKEAYILVRKEEQQLKKARFLENGGEDDDFEFVRDQTDEQFDALVKAFQERRNEHRKLKERELVQNLTTKQEILEGLRKLIESNKANKQSFDKLHELQDKWRTTGKVAPAESQRLWENYKFLVDKFFEVIKLNNELRELDFKRNLEIKTKLCENAEELLIEASLNRALDHYKSLMDQWKDVGLVAKEHAEVIWERFKRVGDELHERRKEILDVKNKQSDEVLAAKTALCEKAEEMVSQIAAKNHNEWQELSNQFNLLLDEWKKAGFASKAENEKVWERFKQTRNAFFDAKEIFYKELRKVQTDNYKLKNELCMEAEALRDSTEWKASAERLRALQEIWKNTGPISKKHSDKLWSRFRTACDAFFETRKKHFSGQDNEQQENLRLKQVLIEEITTFVHLEDAQATIETLKEFQNRYTNIGFVPIKQKEQVYQEYKKAIDKQFDKLRAAGQEVRKQMFKSQINHIAQSKEARPMMNAKKNEILERIKKIQSDVSVLENNIGFLAKSKGADALKKEVEQKIDKSRKDIQNLRDQLSIINETAKPAGA